MASKKMTQDRVHAALNCDDILCEILLRLPANCIFKFVIVSKQWLHLICSSSFHQSHKSRWRGNFQFLGFFVQNSLYMDRPRDGFRPLEWEPTLPLLSTSKELDNLKLSGFFKRLGYFIHSSNGVLLCGFHPKTYYVCNPITRRLFQIPQPQTQYRDISMTLVCEDDQFCYKVIRANWEYFLGEVNTVSIETFSSKTGMWDPSTLTCSSTFTLWNFMPATVIRGVIHWWAKQWNVAIYEPDLGQKRIDLIQLPSGKSLDYKASDLGESSDGLLQYGQSCKLGMEIWVLEKEHASNGQSDKRWNLRYKLCFETMWKKNPTILTAIGKQSKKMKKPRLLSFLIQNSESVLIRSGDNILLYYLESGMLEVVRHCPWNFCKVIPYFNSTWPRAPFRHKIQTST